MNSIYGVIRYLSLINMENKMIINNIYELFALNNEDFVDACYEVLLERSPDMHGKRYYLGRLACGFTRESVIYQISKSMEISKIDSIGGLSALLSKEKRKQIFYFLPWNKQNQLEKAINSLVFIKNSETSALNNFAKELAEVKSIIRNGHDKFEGLLSKVLNEFQASCSLIINEGISINESISLANKRDNALKSLSSNYGQFIKLPPLSQELIAKVVLK